MESIAREVLEQTLFVWSIVQNKVIPIKDGGMIGRNYAPFENDQYLDKEHLEFKLENGQWILLGKETTNGTHFNTEVVGPDQMIQLNSFDVLMAGDQIVVVLGKEMVKIDSREDFLKNIKLDGNDFKEQAKSIQTRSVAFLKLEYPNFINLIKRSELQRKVEIAQVKKSNDLKPFDERIEQLQAKRSKIEAAWNDKINQFKKAISAIRDEQ